VPRMTAPADFATDRLTPIVGSESFALVAVAVANARCRGLSTPGQMTAINA
jgi:hypothetical protein